MTPIAVPNRGPTNIYYVLKRTKGTASPWQQETIDRKKVKSIEPSKTSPLPEGLLGLLTQEEIADPRQANPVWRHQEPGL